MDASPLHVAIAGRMMFKRVMGKLLSAISRTYRETFRYMLQETLSEQILMQTLRNLISAISSVWKVLHLEPGTGEISIHAEKMTLLSKSLQILPEKFHGLTDTDMRYRQRYVDLIMNQESKNVFIKRSQVIKEIRNLLLAVTSWK